MVTPILPLKLADVRVRKKGKMIIGPITTELAENGFTVLLGPNGSGKTTLLRTMHGLERIHTGSVSWHIDEPATRSRQAFVFQTPIIMRRSVQENLAYPLRLGGLSRAKARHRAEKQAAQLGLSDALQISATALSAGEKQKLATARAMIRQPDVLFLDEPTANLDGQATREIETMLQSAYESGTRIVLATHDLGQARRLAIDILFLCRGRLIESGPAEHFFENARSPEARAFMRGDIVE